MEGLVNLWKVESAIGCVEIAKTKSTGISSGHLPGYDDCIWYRECHPKALRLLSVFLAARKCYRPASVTLTHAYNVFTGLEKSGVDACNQENELIVCDSFSYHLPDLRFLVSFQSDFF